jgi:HAE1 family hydrophobic/amphiphilic exporter-1
MLPLALDRSEDSGLWSPLAITVIGGMISSTILALFLIPCIYSFIYPKQDRIKERHNP